MIKLLAPEDFTAELVAPVFEEVASAVPGSDLPDKLDVGWVVKEWGELMRAGYAETWAWELHDGQTVGLLGGLFLREFFTGQPMAMEQFWFVAREYRRTRIGLYLLKAFEAEAARRKVKTIWAGSNRYHDPGRMMKLYQRLGYKWWGSTFRKIV